MANSSLVKYTKLSPFHSGKRKYDISRITIHCVVGQVTMKRLGEIFSNPVKLASCNYGVCTDGICLIVDEQNRSWCSSNSDNDNRAITIEVASDTKSPYKVKDEVYHNLLNLIYDICIRHNKRKLVWFGDKERTLSYKPKDDELVLTVHRWFAKKDCPGDFLYNKHKEIVEIINNALSEGCEMGCKYFVDGKCKKGIDLSETVEKIKKSNEEIAKEVLNGKWGNGATRKKKLQEAGYNYNTIQKIVNNLLKKG